MPSGAKKRKAAKKKKASSSSNKPNSTSHSRGDDNRKHYESDASDYLFTEGEEEEVVKKTGENSRVEVKKSVEDVKNYDGKVDKRAAGEDGVVQVARDSKQDKAFDKKQGSSKSSISSRSSDDEYHAVKKDIAIIGNGSVVDSVKAVDSFSQGPSQVTHTMPASKSENYPQKVSSLDEKALEGSGASAGNSLSPNVGVQKENGERKLSSVEVNSRLPEVVKDLASENKKDKVTSGASTSDAKESTAHESEEKLMLSYNAPRDDAIKDAEHVKDSEVRSSSERQPLIAPPQPAKTTSWKSCCGLFEAFTGSNA